MSAKTDKDSYHVDRDVSTSPSAVVVDKNRTSMFVYSVSVLSVAACLFSTVIEQFDLYNFEYLRLFYQCLNKLFFARATDCTMCAIFTARCSYVSTVLGVVILSVRPSVCHMRAL